MKSTTTSPRGAAAATRPWPATTPIPVIDQVIELPVVMRHVIHHRRHTLSCPGCRARTTAGAVPEAACGFGPRLQAATAYFSGVGRLGKRAIASLFADLFGIPIALGSVSNLEARTGDALGPIHDQASATRQGPRCQRRRDRLEAGPEEGLGLGRGDRGR